MDSVAVEFSLSHRQIQHMPLRRKKPNFKDFLTNRKFPQGPRELSRARVRHPPL